jgi:hypothetical protein
VVTLRWVARFVSLVAAALPGGPVYAKGEALPPGVEAFAPVAESRAEILRAQVEQLLPGRYDNAALLPPDKAASAAWQLTTIITPVEVPALGGRLYHVQEYRDGSPAALTRVRLYRFSIKAGKLDLHLLNPRDMAAARDVAAAARLTPADVAPDRGGCALAVTGFGGQIAARMKSRACRVGAQWVDYEMLLGEDMLVTCHARRAVKDDRLTWLQMPAFPCIRQSRVAPAAGEVSFSTD